jgi:hypothetical protein
VTIYHGGSVPSSFANTNIFFSDGCYLILELES